MKHCFEAAADLKVSPGVTTVNQEKYQGLNLAEHM